MGWLTTGNTRRLAGASLVVLFALIGIVDAAETDVVCKVLAAPSKFDHQPLTLEGIVAGLRKSISRSGRKEMTFILSSPRGCGGVIVYAQEPATWTQGDRVRVEGTFEMEHRREGIIFQRSAGIKNRCVAAVAIATSPCKIERPMSLKSDWRSSRFQMDSQYPLRDAPALIADENFLGPEETHFGQMT